MPIYKHGDIFDNELGKADLIMVATCSVLDKNGDLVMGKGSALAAKERFPFLPVVFGDVIQGKGLDGKFYGIVAAQETLITRKDAQTGKVLIDKFPCRLAGFQSKRHWRDPSNPELIRDSAKMLLRFGKRFNRIALTKPGVGAGELEDDEVEPILAMLPDNYIIYTK